MRRGRSATAGLGVTVPQPDALDRWIGGPRPCWTLRAHYEEFNTLGRTHTEMPAALLLRQVNEMRAH